MALLGLVAVSVAGWMYWSGGLNAAKRGTAPDIAPPMAASASAPPGIPDSNRTDGAASVPTPAVAASPSASQVDAPIERSSTQQETQATAPDNASPKAAPALDTAALARAREAREKREREERMREIERQRDLERQRQLAEEQRRQQEAQARAAAERAQREAAARAAAPADATSRSPAPASTPSVDQQCANSGNFVAREWCRIQQCQKAEMANDPICVRFRQLEADRRRQQLGN